ncbi:hypothetical protein MBLNU459_g1180t2 [Dothideomycetes sp. NU459]
MDVSATDYNEISGPSSRPSQISMDNTSIPEWPKLGLDDKTGPPQILDWTRHPIANLSQHQHFVRNLDWASTTVGPISAWPLQLRMLVIATFGSTNPRIILWGPDHIMIYNSAAIARLGSKHPYAMGKPAYEVHGESWSTMPPLIKPAILRGQSVKIDKELAFLDRNGIKEETWWSFTLAPIIGPNGYAVGAVQTFFELTSFIVMQRRRGLLSRTTDEVSKVATLKDLWARFLQSLEPSKDDVPFALIYAAEDDDSAASQSSWSQPTRRYLLEGAVGIDTHDLPKSFDLTPESTYSSGTIQACRKAWDSRKTVVLSKEDDTLPEELAVVIPDRGYGDQIHTVCVMPIAPGGIGFLVVGFNPRRPFNNDSLRFAHNLHDVLAKPSAFISQQRFEEIHDSLSLQLRASTLEAARNEEKFTKMADASPIGICTFHPDGRTLYVNDEYLRLIGVPRVFDKSFLDNEVDWKEQIIQEDMGPITDAWKALLDRKASTVTIQYRIRRPWKSIDTATGSQMVGETWLLNKATSELDEKGNVAYVHAWLLDVSHQHYTEKLLGRRLDEALETKVQTERFIDLVSHELRNPLSAILQSADGILTTLDEARSTKADITNSNVLEAAQTIILCAQHQKCIVDDILTLSKLDSNLLVITPDKIQPPHLVKKVLRMYEAELQRAGVEATLQIEDSYTQILQYQDQVMLDPSRLLQVVINLLTNAIKFTQYMDERRITVHLGASHERPDGARHNLEFIPTRKKSHEQPMALTADWGEGEDLYLQLTVQDTGRGLTDEEMKLLFQRFSQASPKTYKQYGGSGLGLFISRELTELQGGQIGVSSKGAGKGSTFAFYVRARTCAIQDRMDSTTPLSLNHVWNTTVTGSTVIPRAHDSPCSVVMPAMTLPMSKKRTHSLINSDPLIDSAISESPVVNIPQRAPLNILVVEDNLINQRVMAQQLKKFGCTVHIANHGVEALAFLRRTDMWRSDPSSNSPAAAAPLPLSVVLMDLEMPVMDGLTCVREMRQLEALGELTVRVPVIAVTANARNEQIAVAIEAGMDDVVTKPFRIPDLIPQIEALIARTSEMTVE